MDLSAEAPQGTDRRVEGPGEALGHWSPTLASMYSEVIKTAKSHRHCPRGATRPMKNVGQVEFLTPASGQLILMNATGNLRNGIYVWITHGPGLSQRKLVNECELSRQPLFLSLLEGSSDGAGGQSRCSLTSYAHSDTCLGSKCPHRFPPGQVRECVCECVFVCVCVLGGGN